MMLYVGETWRTVDKPLLIVEVLRRYQEPIYQDDECDRVEYRILTDTEGRPFTPAQGHIIYVYLMLPDGGTEAIARTAPVVSTLNQSVARFLADHELVEHGSD
jgi:hypothetical protein